ncbi:Transmembrane and TPR repeat-containing protein 4 [Eufriesea mexicana]|uniref:Transmembrane and TPR repeat-containing protein 4 n=1 Tax=Eufriesea mexicana TaxID=516756 RepID=A0A310SSD9_9HYME|nr:Transmembrane and TPR repeat-containing protein 4 [Eufriesea mexicana]
MCLMCSANVSANQVAVGGKVITNLDSPAHYLADAMPVSLNYQTCKMKLIALTRERDQWYVKRRKRVVEDFVTGIVGRADVLACIFFLLSFLAYHGQQTAYVWSSVGLGALSMLAKETGITVLPLNLLYDLCRSWHSIKRSIFEARWNDDSRHFSRRAAALLVSFGVLLVVRLALLHGALPKFSPQDNPAAFHPCFHVSCLPPTPSQPGRSTDGVVWPGSGSLRTAGGGQASPLKRPRSSSYRENVQPSRVAFAVI